MKESPKAVAVAADQEAANAIFGTRFDDLRLESYGAAALDLGNADVLGLSGGPEMLPLLGEVLKGSQPTVRELHLHLGDDVRSAVAQQLAAAAGWIVTDVDRAVDGSPVVTVKHHPDSGHNGVLVPLSLDSLVTGEPAPSVAWPGSQTEPAEKAASAPQQRPARPTKRPAAPPPPRRGLPALGGRGRAAALLLAVLAVVAAVVLVVVGVVWGFEALVVVLLLGIAALLAIAILGIAYVARAVLRARAEQAAGAAAAQQGIVMQRKAVQRASNRHKRVTGALRHNAELLKAVTTAQNDTQEYLSTFAAREIEYQTKTTEYRAETTERNRLAHLATQRQVQALLHLDRLVRPAVTPPMGGWAASPDLLALCLDLLIERKPSCVVETGSGVSTLYLAAAAEAYGLDCRIVALEHNERFARATRELLERNGLAHRAEVRLAPLAPTDLPDHPTRWYDRTALEDLTEIGMLLVDGPPEAIGREPRYPAVPLLHERFAERCVVIADDIIRPADRHAVERWVESELAGFDLTLRTDLEKHAAVLRRG